MALMSSFIISLIAGVILIPIIKKLHFVEKYVRNIVKHILVIHYMCVVFVTLMI